MKYPRFVIEAIVCLPKDDSAGMLSFLEELKVGRDIPWFLTAANVAGSCRLSVELLDLGWVDLNKGCT